MLKSILYLALSLYATALLGLYVFQRNFLYFPYPVYTPPQEAQAPAALRELAVRTEDGLDLKAWYAPATSKPMIGSRKSRQSLAIRARMTRTFETTGDEIVSAITFLTHRHAPENQSRRERSRGRFHRA